MVHAVRDGSFPEQGSSVSAECGLSSWELTDLRDLEKAHQRKLGWEASCPLCQLGGEPIAGFRFISNSSSCMSQG